MDVRRRAILSEALYEGGSSEGPINTDNYLTIEARENGLTASLSVNACEYCVDGDGNWKTLSAGTATESINSGQTLSFRGDLNPVSYEGIGTFTISKKCNLKGNCMSMLFGDDAMNNYSLSGKDYAFQYLFRGCKTIIQVSESFLSATTLVYMGYDGMFSGCTALTTAPELPATKLDSYCYQYMFSGCTALTTAPELPATKLASYCYQYMFSGCNSLTSSPKLPATTLASYCYQYMFSGTNVLPDCSNIDFNSSTIINRGVLRGLFAGTKVTDNDLYNILPINPATGKYWLPATTLAQSCYSSMFSGCTSLTTAPELPATTLAEGCYKYMFDGCTKLNYIKMLATNISASQCLYYWVNGVASSGTFVKNPVMTTLPTGTSGIPSGWTVVNDGEESDGNLTFPVTLVDGDNGQLGIDLFNYLIDKYDEQVIFNQHSITEQITINSTAGSYYNGDVVNILTQLSDLQETPTWICLATPPVLNQGRNDWFTRDYFILYNNGYLEYYSD